jgi:hypothetical protein
VQSPFKPPPTHVAWKKCPKCAKSEKSPILTYELASFLSIMEALLQYLDRENIPLRLEPTSAGDKGTICLPTRYVLAVVPFAIRRASSPGLGWPGLSGGVAFPKLSKLLNQEDALSAPFLRVESRSPQAAPSQTAPMLRTGVIRHFDVTLQLLHLSRHACER